jgi:hypothetical protein
MNETPTTTKPDENEIDPLTRLCIHYNVPLTLDDATRARMVSEAIMNEAEKRERRRKGVKGAFGRQGGKAFATGNFTLARTIPVRKYT